MIINFNKKIERKKFFTSLGISLLGITVLNRIPFNLFGNKKEQLHEKHQQNGTGKIQVRINPLAVNRTTVGGKHA